MCSILRTHFISKASVSYSNPRDLNIQGAVFLAYHLLRNNVREMGTFWESFIVHLSVRALTWKRSEIIIATFFFDFSEFSANDNAEERIYIYRAKHRSQHIYVIISIVPSANNLRHLRIVSNTWKRALALTTEYVICIRFVKRAYWRSRYDH